MVMITDAREDKIALLFIYLFIYYVLYVMCVTVLEGSWLKQAASEQDVQNTRIPMSMEG